MILNVCLDEYEVFTLITSRKEGSIMSTQEPSVHVFVSLYEIRLKLEQIKYHMVVTKIKDVFVFYYVSLLQYFTVVFAYCHQ